MGATYKLAVGPVVEFKVTLAYTDGSKPCSATLQLQGKRLDEPALRELRGREGQTVADLLVEQLVGWGDQALVLDEAGQPAAFSADALRCLLSLPGAANVVFGEYVRAIGVEAKRGN